eukprot:7770528-Pyramimonas_sp.AAC.1
MATSSTTFALLSHQHGNSHHHGALMRGRGRGWPGTPTKRRQDRPPMLKHCAGKIGPLHRR